jgi:hypothetical protein
MRQVAVVTRTRAPPETLSIETWSAGNGAGIAAVATIGTVSVSGSTMKYTRNSV